MEKEKTGEVIGPFLDGTPEVMAELTREFIREKDLNSRARIRLRMKALLDLLSADTDYPPVPSLNPDLDEDAPGQYRLPGANPPRRRHGRAIGVQPAFLQPGPAPAAPAAPQVEGGFVAIPGAENANNEVIL